MRLILDDSHRGFQIGPKKLAWNSSKTCEYVGLFAVSHLIHFIVEKHKCALNENRYLLFLRFHIIHAVQRIMSPAEGDPVPGPFTILVVKSGKHKFYTGVSVV
jgi:hypothetical protein